MALGPDFAGQEGHGGPRSDDDRIVPGDQCGGGGPDGPFLGNVPFLLLVDVAVADVGADQDGAAVRAVEFLLLFEVGKVLADGHLRNAEEFGELRHGNGTVLLQKRQNPTMTFRKAQKGSSVILFMMRCTDISYSKSPSYKIYSEKHTLSGYFSLLSGSGKSDSHFKIKDTTF